MKGKEVRKEKKKAKSDNKTNKVKSDYQQENSSKRDSITSKLPKK
ncbi:MAG: hypothetical protein RSF01_06465 [Bacteroidales bacterium]